MRKSGKWNFTLVELLIVIAIIAILAGMLLPALRAALRQGKIISCTGNQKQIAFGLSNYASDNKEWFPERGITSTMLNGNTWHRALLVGGYISRPMTGGESSDNKKRGKNILLCPEDTSPYAVTSDDALSYGINGMISWSNVGSSTNAHYIPRLFLVKGRRCNNPNHTETIKKSPSEIALTGDSFNSLVFQPWASTDKSPLDPATPRCTISPRHTTGTVLSFVDGHAGFFKFPFSANCLNIERFTTF